MILPSVDFAGAGWTDDAEAFTRREAENDTPSATNGPILAGRRNVVDDEAALPACPRGRLMSAKPASLRP